jgi:NADH-quinone oxidoreductase subunit L
MPVTFWTFLIGGMALSGCRWSRPGSGRKMKSSPAPSTTTWYVFGVLALAALLTAFYTARQITMTFLGQPRTEVPSTTCHESTRHHDHPADVLAVFAVAAGWVGIPAAFPGGGNFVPNCLKSSLAAWCITGTRLRHRHSMFR